MFFNLFSKPTTLESTLSSLQIFRVGPRVGYSKKELKKALLKLTGKNFENVLTDVEGIMSVNFWGHRPPKDWEVVEQMFLNGTVVYLPVFGKTRDKFMQIAELCQTKGGEFDHPLYISNHRTTNWAEEFCEHIFDETLEYIVKSGDKDAAKLFPKKCKSCDGVLSFRDIEVDYEEDEDGNEIPIMVAANEVNISFEGSCSRCGYLMVEDMKKNIFKIYPSIKKFEEEKGVIILPRVS